MGPGYQGAAVLLRLIKFSTAMHLSGVQADNVVSAEHGQALHPRGPQSQNNQDV